MGATLMRGPQSLVRVLGSLWFAAVLLVVLLVAMACATVFESSRGTEMALEIFYRAPWFKALLGLLAANVFAAMVVRYPFTRKQIGFVLTHVSILLTLAGSLITAKYGIDGQVGIAEGQTVREFAIPQATLTLAKRGETEENTVELTSRAFSGFKAVDNPEAPLLTAGDLKLQIARFIPHSVVAAKVVDDNPHPSLAVEVSFAQPGHHHTSWLYDNRPPIDFDSLRVGFRSVASDAELSRLISDQPVDDAAGDGVVKVAFAGMDYQMSMSDCLERAMPVGDLSYTVRVLRYLPHAQLDANNKLFNASEHPVNPAIEVELIGPEGTEKHIAFANFPEFGSMHGDGKTEAFTITFVSPQSSKPTLPVEILSGPGGEMYVRFFTDDVGVSSHKLALGVPIDSPWPGRPFTVLRRFEHARTERVVAQEDPPKKGRTPAILVRLNTSEHASEMWVQQFRPSPVTVDGTAYDLIYANKIVPLGFALTLNNFEVGYYPGGRRPRSFESHITVDDPASGGPSSSVVSMNHPASYGEFTLYQSRYREEPGRPAVSFLSVSRDPGQPIVFAGYIGLMIGMVIVLGTRIVQQRRMAGRARSGAGGIGLGVDTSGVNRAAVGRTPSPVSVEAR